MKIKLLIVSILLLISLCVQAQFEDSTGFYHYPYRLAQKQPKWIIKWAFTSLLDFDRTVQFAGEYFVRPAFSVQGEAGFGNFASDINNSYQSRQVWRLRGEGRYYFRSYQQEDFGMYVAGDVFYKKMSTIKEDVIDWGNYSQRINYSYIKDVSGFNLKLGGQVFLSKRLVLDIYLGAGMRHIKVKTPDKFVFQNNIILPLGNEQDSWGLSIDAEEAGYYNYPNITFGFKIGYVIY